MYTFSDSWIWTWNKTNEMAHSYSILYRESYQYYWLLHTVEILLSGHNFARYRSTLKDTTEPETGRVQQACKQHISSYTPINYWHDLDLINKNSKKFNSSAWILRWKDCKKLHQFLKIFWHPSNDFQLDTSVTAIL